MTIPWQEKGKRELEAKVPCPTCESENLIRGVDTPYFFECEKQLGFLTAHCEKCGEPMAISKQRSGVIVEKSPLLWRPDYLSTFPDSTKNSVNVNKK